jgi:RNA polymerase sigma-70 factor (ECF subfamily)
MNGVDLEERLSRIGTRWTMLLRSQAEEPGIAMPARAFLSTRYREVVYRYLLGAVRDPDVAEELSQEVALRFMEGRFHLVRPGKGRFRDYLRTVLINLVRDHHASRARRPRELPEQVVDRSPAPDPEDAFNQVWCRDLLKRTWDALREERPTYCALLRIHIDEPELSSRELAERLTAERSEPMTPENVRQTLGRARNKFGELLVAEVAESLDDPDPDRLRAELEEFDLLKYCRSALERWAADKRPGRR